MSDKQSQRIGCRASRGTERLLSLMSFTWYEVQWLIEDRDVAAAEEKLATFDRIARRVGRIFGQAEHGTEGLNRKFERK